MATGDIRIDALLEPGRISLAYNHQPGTGAVISYSFLRQVPGNYAVDDFRPLDAGQQAAVRVLLTEISSQIGVTFEEVDQGGLLQYGLYSGRTGVPKTPDYKAEGGTTDNEGIVWLNWQVPDVANLGGGYGRQLLVHETGHLLGLKHPGQYSQYDQGPYLPIELATAGNTVMAYNGGNTEHFGAFDLLSLQYLYGTPGNEAIPRNTLAANELTNYGSYANDAIQFDWHSYTNPYSPSINGLAGHDELTINASYKGVSVKTGQTSVLYNKEGGSYGAVFLQNVERVHFTDRSLALDTDGVAGQAYRLYQAAFDRTPDKPGLGYWIDKMDAGASLYEVAAGFVASTEFQALNGSAPASQALVASLYGHVLGRTAEQAGLDYWTSQLQSGALDAAGLLASLSESAENRLQVSGQIAQGIEYQHV
ncbi:DUF4214 domain-containing protein [Pseudomonas sp. MS15a(2019)]|uniref:DUF4214 domain-containing protein n=1 Tax=Pseudomonas sp. MS15a(2019) TaxID=2579938 RepID=UPI001566E32D|nr:DUF4214 domain-containing protein [Pseudomonas sp. MS15a(2019)]NRH43905.1 DUF4214 domain-containing protein [Pseudomonas sp. MS15a(2019)]